MSEYTAGGSFESGKIPNPGRYVPNPGAQILGIFVNPSDPPKKAKSGKRKSSMKKRSTNGKRSENAVRVKNARRRKPGTKRRKKRASSSVTVRRRRKARAANPRGRRKKRMSSDVKALLAALKGKKRRKSSRRRKRNPSDSAVERLERIRALQLAASESGLDRLTAAKLRDQIDELKEDLPLALLGEDIDKVMGKVDQYRATKSRRKARQALVDQALSRPERKKALVIAQAVLSNEVNLSDLGLPQESRPAVVGGITLDPESARYGSRDVKEALLGASKTEIQNAIRLLQEEADVPELGISSSSRKIRSAYKKALQRLNAAKSGRIVNPYGEDDDREENPGRRRRRRRRKFDKYDMKPRRRRRRRRRRNPAEGDFVMQLLVGNFDVKNIAGAAISGLGGFAVAGGIGCMVAEKIANAFSAKNVEGKKAIHVAGTAVIGAGVAAVASMLVGENSLGGMLVGVAARTAKEAVDLWAAPTSKSLRSAVGLQGLHGGQSWGGMGYYYMYNPVMNGYSMMAPAMNGLPSAGYMNGYSMMAPAMNGLPSAGYAMRGLPAAGYTGR